MLTRRFMWLLLGIGVGIVAGVAVFRAGDAPIQLPDGSTVALKKITFGKTDQITVGNAFARALTPLLPPAWARKLGLQAARLQTTNDVLFAWLEFRNSTNRGAMFHYLTVADERGLESAWIPVHRIFTTRDGSTVVGFVSSNFPRRSKTISFCLYETLKPTGQGHAVVRRVARFRHANPAPTPAFTASVEPLPLTRTQHEEPFTLVQAQTGLSATGQTALQAITWTELIFQLGSIAPTQINANPSALQWQIMSLHCRSGEGNFIQFPDLFGHVVRQRANAVTGQNDDGVQLLSGALWPDETWNIRVELQPGPLGNIPETSAVTFRNLTVPTPGTTNRLNLRSNSWDAKVSVVSIGVPAISDAAIATNRLLQLRTPIFIEARMESTNPVHQLRLVRARDNRGSNVARAHVLPLESTNYRVFAHRDATSLDVTLGVFRRYSVDLTVRPVVQNTNVAHRTERSQ